MLRAVRFAAKLDFEIDPATAAPIAEAGAAAARYAAGTPVRRMLKLFLAGHALARLSRPGTPRHAVGAAVPIARIDPHRSGVRC